jgi:hypothetical protein
MIHYIQVSCRCFTCKTTTWEDCKKYFSLIKVQLYMWLQYRRNSSILGNISNNHTTVGTRRDSVTVWPEILNVNSITKNQFLAFGKMDWNNITVTRDLWHNFTNSQIEKNLTQSTSAMLCTCTSLGYNWCFINYQWNCRGKSWSWWCQWYQWWRNGWFFFWGWEWCRELWWWVWIWNRNLV